MRMRQGERGREREREGGRNRETETQTKEGVAVPSGLWTLVLFFDSTKVVSMVTGVRLCVYVFVCVCVCTATNVDTAFPMLKQGGDGSLFGLSVSLHQSTQKDSFMLLVGAPREKAEAHVPANRTGGVYACPVSADQSDCRRMNLIGSDPDLNKNEDLFEDMWLGVSVTSQGRPGGRVLACGHRFMKMYGAYRLRHMIGKCYLRGNDLLYDPEDMHWQNLDQACSHLLEVSSEVMCNMGISAAITQTEVIVGSPGSYEWQGNVHVSWMNPDVLYDSHKSSFPNLNQRNIYMGYSVTQAPRLLSWDVETIVTGAPKDSKEDVRGSVFLAKRQSNVLKVQQILRGEQMGSYYGNAVATTDLNNDGWNDLLVGAPFYFHRQLESGGAVYIYMNAGGRFESLPSAVLRGPAGSAFGMSLAAAGDLNQDGFQDFAVGAPFHGTGSVMIWTGSADTISEMPSQVIEGGHIWFGFRTFGFSLSGGLDVDGNRYPDLLVGSLDDSVALLRTRPVIHLNQTLKVSPEVVDPNHCDYCVQVEVCLSYTVSTGDQNYRENITVHFTVSADITRHKPRLYFNDNGQHIYSSFLLMPSRRCETLRLGLQSLVRDKVEPLVFSLNVSLDEKLPTNRRTVQNLNPFPVLSHEPQPIKAQIHIQKACGSDNRCHSNIQMTAQFTNEHQEPFHMQQGVQVFHYNSSIKRLLLEVNITNAPLPGRPAEDAHSAALNVSVPPSLKYSGVRTKGDVQAAVMCSTDVVGFLLCELGNPFKSNHKVQVLIIFQTSEISLDTREIQAMLQLSTLSEQSDLSPVSLTLLVEYSLQTALTLVKQPDHTHFSSHVTGESAMRREDDVGSSLDFTFQVDVFGKPLGHLGILAVEFDWPWEASNGKWLLYLTEIHLEGTSEPQCVPPGNIIDPLNLTQSAEVRTKRSLEEEQVKKKVEQRERTRHALNLQGPRRKSYTLDCVHGAARCVKFICPLTNMKNSATLRVRARLWNSTMTEDYPEAWSVSVSGRATLKLQTNKPTVSMEPHSTQFVVDLHPDRGEQEEAGAPLWVLVVSALAGVLLLAAMILLLWKCGFFARGREGQAAALHQGRILGKEDQKCYTDSNGFLIQDDITSSTNRKRQTPKHWVTMWTETHTC
ncbi:integrin alpha-3-like [Genypterus blacodes]|uniref:integrin alpha-3-like n=1 Tax=Genypterus blacodes TaxID=154954 RepID=UPI003F776287